MKKSILLIVMLLIMVASPAGAALKVNEQAPSFSLPEIGTPGNSFTGPNSKGEAAIVSFFASWCVPCRTELPLLNALSDELGARGIRIVLIGVREAPGTIRQLLTELRIDRAVAVSDRDGRVTEQYQVLFLPTTFFVGADGRVKDIIFGPIKDEAQLRKSAATIAKP